MGKFLDARGLHTLWTQIKANFATPQYVNDTIATIPHSTTQPFINKKQIADYLYEIYYEQFDDEYAKEYFLNGRADEPVGGCSSARAGQYWGRNLDWTYDDSAEFILHTAPYGEKTYAVLGVSGALSGMTKSFVDSNEITDLYKILPYRMVDGINEKGLVVNTNVVPHQKSDSNTIACSQEPKDVVPSAALVFYILTHYASVDEAIAGLTNYIEVYFPQNMIDLDYQSHWMLGDKNKTVIIECIDGAYNIIDVTNKPIMTNFYLTDVQFNTDGTVYTPETADAEHGPVQTNKITTHGAGLERYNIIVGTLPFIETKDNLRNLLSTIRYTNTYQNNMGGNWYSEFVGLMNLDLNSPLADFEAAFPYAVDAFNNRERGDGTWHTTHSCIYDMEQGQLYIVSQEQFDDEYIFKIEINQPAEQIAPITYTAGSGIKINSDNTITYDPDVLPTVDYVDLSISDTLTYVEQQDASEHAGRVAGDNLLQTAIKKKMSLIEGNRPFINWDGVTANLPMITINREQLYKLNDVTIEEKFHDADGKTLNNFSYVIMENGAPVSHLGSGWIAGSDITGVNHVIMGRASDKMVLISGPAGSYTATIDAAEYPFDIPEDGTYVAYIDNNNYVYKIFVEENTTSMLQQNDNDITEATAEALSPYLATKAQMENVQNRITNLQNRLDEGGCGGSSTDLIVLGQDVTLICSEEDPWAEGVEPESVTYACQVSTDSIPEDFWDNPSHYNFIVTIKSTDAMTWGYTANHFCYMIDNYENNWSIVAFCEDLVNALNVKHLTVLSKETSENVLNISYQGFMEDSPSLPVAGNICSVYLQKLYTNTSTAPTDITTELINTAITQYFINNPDEIVSNNELDAIFNSKTLDDNDLNKIIG